MTPCVLPHPAVSSISIGQLDEHGCEVLIKHDILHIRDLKQRLLAKMNWAKNRLYLLDLCVVQPMCLAARGRTRGDAGMPSLGT